MVKHVTRLPDWRARLSSYLTSASAARFEWGVRDCVIHPADGVLAMTGVDLAEDIRGRYMTRIGAARVLRRCGGTLAEAFAQRLPEIDPDAAIPGDVVVFKGSLGETGGLRLASSISAVTDVGLCGCALDQVARAFQIGDR